MVGAVLAMVAVVVASVLLPLPLPASAESFVPGPPPSTTSGPSRSTDDAPAVTITAELAAGAVRVGKSTYVTGRVDPAGVTPNVVVQRLVDGRWSDVAASAPLPANGSFRVKVTPSKVGTYTLRVRSAGGGVISPSVRLESFPLPAISARLSTSSVAVGTPILLWGMVSPRGTTPRVVLQRLVNGRWSGREVAPVDPDTGSFGIALTPTQVANYTLRVRSNGGTVVSPAVRVTTFYKAFTTVDVGASQPGEKVVSLTFDDGPGPYTDQVLDVLARHGVTATFFVVGREAAARPDTLKRVVRAGHHVGNHTWDHADLTRLGNDAVRAEIGRTQELLLGAGGAPRCVRPPYGANNRRVQQLIAEFRSSATMLWDIDPRDWDGPPSSATIVDRVMRGLHPGAVVLMHDGGGRRTNTVAALDALIPRIQAVGYKIRPIC